MPAASTASRARITAGMMRDSYTGQFDQPGGAGRLRAREGRVIRMRRVVVTVGLTLLAGLTLGERAGVAQLAMPSDQKAAAPAVGSLVTPRLLVGILRS
jgi:hypothetical protein